MNLTVVDSDELSDADKDLVKHLQKALQPIERSFTSSVGDDYIVAALIYSNPLRVDFIAHEPGRIGQAFLGPIVVVDETIFDEDELTPTFLQNMQVAFDTFSEYLAKEHE